MNFDATKIKDIQADAPKRTGIGEASALIPRGAAGGLPANRDTMPKGGYRFGGSNPALRPNVPKGE